MMAGLNIDIFNTEYRPVPSAIPVWPDGRQATWPATTSTLISGERDGVLVDALVTKGESQELADWLATTGKNLTEVYITHAHGDHFFGLNTVLDKFPKARAVACRSSCRCLPSRRRPNGCRSGTASSLTSCSRSR
jgi:glyoxylase-like metal-dependent hydrolase (beta-lactamase superfamily II)